MTASCADLDPFFDGELAADAADAFRSHLVDCDRCQRVLRGRMQEEILVEVPDAGAVAPGAARAQAGAASVTPIDSRRRKVLYLAPAVAAAAAAAIWLGTRGPSPASAPVELAMKIEHRGAAARGDTAHVGDVARLVVRGGGHRALWVYLGDRELVIACPGGASCAGGDAELAVELRFAAPGQYKVIAVVSDQPVAAPEGALDVMLSTVTAAGAHIKITPIDVN
jgi:anti-sigma factor RsiW